MITRRALFTLDFDRPGRAGGRWLRVHRTAMACRFEVTLRPDDSDHVGAARAALDEADRVEAALTVFCDTSEIARVNREANEGPSPVDAELFALLATCAALHADTGGAFDITSTPLSRCWGFLKRDGHVPPAAELDAARGRVGMTRVALDAAARTVRFAAPGMELNLGSIGKGYALDCMGRLLARAGASHALVSAGGSSVLAVGGRGRGWAIDIRSPQVARDRIARLHLRNGALGTSGAGEQFVVANGTRYGHVIDPRTGWPAAGVLSASVVTRDAAAADALSTALLIGGEPLARAYCDRHRDTLVLLTLDNEKQETRVCGAYAGAGMDIQQD
jgi:FAD:protein FMN transferase